MAKSQNETGSLPSEIWTIILSKVQARAHAEDDEGYFFNDLYNCSRVCTTFLKILEPTKSTWLFGEVIQFINQYLGGRDVLRCRVTCKLWKIAVDRNLETEAFSSTKTRKKPTCVLSHWHNIAKFRRDMKDWHGNPFPGRALSIYYGLQSSRTYTQFWSQDVPRLLKKFGCFLHTLHLKMCFNEDLKKLILCLKFTRNLRALSLQGMDFTSYQSEKRVYFASQQRMPVLPFLSSLRFEPGGCFSHPGVCTKIRVALQCSIASQYAQQLRKLEINFVYGHSESCHVEYPASNFPNLEDLHVTVKSLDQLYSIFRGGQYQSKVLRRVTMKLVQFSNRHSMVYLLESPNTTVLVEFLRPLLEFRESLCELTVINEGFKYPLIMTSDKDFFILESSSDLNIFIWKDFGRMICRFCVHCPLLLSAFI